jgi:hypothetical protein
MRFNKMKRIVTAASTFHLPKKQEVPLVFAGRKCPGSAAARELSFDRFETRQHARLGAEQVEV